MRPSLRKNKLKRKVTQRKINRLIPYGGDDITKKLEGMIRLTDHFHKRANERVLERRKKQIILGISRGNIYTKPGYDSSYYVLHSDTTYVLSFQLILMTAYPGCKKKNLTKISTEEFLRMIGLIR